MFRIVKYIAIGLCAIVVIIGIGAAFNLDKVKRLHSTITLFNKDKITHNFSHMNEMFFTVPIKKPPVEVNDVFQFGQDKEPLPTDFTYQNEVKSVEEFLTRRATTALFIVKDDKVKFEKYYLGTGENDLRIAWSVSKSFVSALMGIAVGEGLIDIDKPVTDYVPSLKGSGYDGVKIKDVLYMSSGVAWNEDYSDFFSDINKMGRVLSVNGSLDEFASTLKKGREPGTEWQYVSMDTHVLSMVVRAATGQKLSKLLQVQIWSKIGVEADGYWLTDASGAEFALGGLNIRTRDFARFGRLFVQGGKWNGEQIVPQQWVEDSIKAGAPNMKGSKTEFGYGYQWWLGFDARPGEFMAVGVYGQYIYINQPENIVIVKNSSDRFFMNEIGGMAETVSFFRGVVDSYHNKDTAIAAIAK